MTARLSVDIGGTFTDVVVATASSVFTTKVLTTYEDPALGVLQGIEQVLAQSQVDAQDISLVLHGTTLATNALIERRGALTGFITTLGHRDVLEMAFENRFEQYDVNIDRPLPLVPRWLRLGVPERMSASGQVLLPLDEAAVIEVLEQMRTAGVTSIAVGLLHSYVNPTHEQQIADLIKQHAPDVSVSLSSAVCPEIREFERFSTTVANAYVRPLMAQYLDSLAEKLQQRGIGAQVLLMTSGGGLTTLATAARFPIRLVESGPAGGAILAAHLAREQAFNEVLSFDMGGTTAKICLIDKAQPFQSRAFEVDRSYRFKKGSGLPIRIPVIEMVEIGAGGGSIAQVDAMQRVQVGPESAGSEPGPMCYGRGGDQPTVTDADVTVGRLRPELFAGGNLQLDDRASHTGLAEVIGEKLAMSASQAAHAVLEIVEENMAAAARAHAGEWGKDLNQRAMIAFGGAAPLHAATLARKLKISRVLVPAGAGVGSAIGFLLAPVRFEVVRSDVSLLAELDLDRVRKLMADMFDEAQAVLKQAGLEVADKQIQAYMRYAGQGYEVAVPVDDEHMTVDALREGFLAAYAELYGRSIPNVPVEVLSWTMALSGPAIEQGLSKIPAHGDEGSTDTAVIQLYDGESEVPARLLHRSTLPAGEPMAGPLLIVEPQTTVHVPEGMQVVLQDRGDLLIEEIA